MRGKFIGGGERGFCNTTLHPVIFSTAGQSQCISGRFNVLWGQGQTPIKEVLHLMRQEKWTFPAEVELEYKIPEGSSAVAEVAKCVQYCKEALA
jgi:hypothetical protein